jgi:hypothetical protein
LARIEKNPVCSSFAEILVMDFRLRLRILCLLVEWEVVIGGDEIPLLSWEMLFLRVLLYVFYAAPYLFEGVEEDFVGARGDDGVMGRHFVGEAKAQATSDGFCEVVPHRQGIVLVRADQEVNVILADGAA